MISENVAKACQEFCAENRDILSSYSFDGDSMDHVAVRFIQRVAVGVQFADSDKSIQKNSIERISCLMEPEEFFLPATSSFHRVAADVQFVGGDYPKKESGGFEYIFPPTIPSFQRVAVGVQFEDSDDVGCFSESAISVKLRTGTEDLSSVRSANFESDEVQ